MYCLIHLYDCSWFNVDDHLDSPDDPTILPELLVTKVKDSLCGKS